MHWLIDGYNVIRRDPALASRERESLEAGREALCRRLAEAGRLSGETFTVVFDGAGHGGSGQGGAAVRVLFSSARESADHVLARLAARGGAVVSSDREVRRAAARAGATPISADEFLARLDRLATARPAPGDVASDASVKEEEPDEDARPRKGNPRRRPRKERAAARALDRLRPSPR